MRCLAPDIRKDDVFLLVQKHAPYAVALCLPDDISFKVGDKESTMRGFENTEQWDQNIDAELIGYVKPEQYIWIVPPGSVNPPPPKFNYDPGINHYLDNCV